MSIIVKTISRLLRRKCLFSALSLLFFILNGIAALSHNNGVGITRTLLQTGEIEQQVYLSSSTATIKAPGLLTGSLEVVAQKVTDLTSLGVLVYDIATDEATRSSIKQQFKEIKDQIGDNPSELFPVLRDVILVVATGNTPEEWERSLNSTDSGERSHLATRGTGNAIVAVASGAAIVKDLPEIAQELGKRVGKSNLFKGARQKAIAQFGKEAENLIYIKFNKDGGAAAEIMAHFGQEGFDALKKVDNIDDAAKELVKNKIVYRAVNENTYNFDKLKKQGIIDATPQERPTYVTIDKYSDATTIQQKLQLPHKPTWIAEFDGNQLVEDIRIPNGKYMNAEYKEVLCKSFPEINDIKLDGGGSQFITNSQIKINRLVNLETGEVILFKH